MAAADWSVKQRVEAESLLQPHTLVFSEDGTRVFVSSNNKSDHMAGHEQHAGMAGGNGNVTVFDASTHEVLKVIELGKNVTGMGARGGR